jgi:hypothetical protein
VHQPAPLSKNPVKSRLSGIPQLQVGAGRFAVVQVDAVSLHLYAQGKNLIFDRSVYGNKVHRPAPTCTISHQIPT